MLTPPRRPTDNVLPFTPLCTAAVAAATILYNPIGHAALLKGE